MLKAVLFDLDDTPFDHKFSPLTGLRALQDKYPKLNAVSLEDLQREHERLLRADYVGDSWSSDALPAVRVSMRAVWLNRYRLKCPNPSIAREIASIVGVKKEFFLNW